MSKTDRIAIVLSLFYLVVPLVALSDGVEAIEAFFICIPLLGYWGHRFIKGDISFMGTKE